MGLELQFCVSDDVITAVQKLDSPIHWMNHV